MKCSLCSMEATYRFAEANGVLKFYCDHHAPAGAERIGASPSVLKTYRPLIIAAAIIIGVSYFLNVNFMGVFFLVFGGTKALAWSDFAKGFAGYDPLAKKSRTYALAYPAIELVLAAMFLFGWQLNIASIITIIILSLTSVGIYGAIRRGETLQCVCLGSLLSLPLGWVTIGENVVMIVMAVITIVLGFNL